MRSLQQVQLQKNDANFTNTSIDQAGALVFKNVSSNLYRVYVNGSQVVELPGGLSYKLAYKPTGAYSIRVLQLNGYIVSPTDQTFTGTLTCGGSLTTTFPQ